MAAENPLSGVVPPPAAEILPSSSGTPLTVKFTPRTMHMVTLSYEELTTLASQSGSIHLAFVGISVGALVAFGITLKTVDISDPKTYAMFVALTALSVITTVFFGVNAYRDITAANARLEQFKPDLKS